MAQIPIGGQLTSIDVSSLALEATQRDILLQSQKTTDALQSIAASQGIALQTDNQMVKSNNEIANEVKSSARKNTEAVGNLTRNMLNNGISLSDSAVKEFSKMTGKEKLSEIASGLSTSMGLAGLGAGLGTAFGIMEEYGASLSALRRTGGGLGEELIALRSRSAEVGLGMEQLAKFAVEFGPAIRSLGNTTRDGTNNFLQMNKQLRENTREMGFFGLETGEMASMLVDEIELRRISNTGAAMDINARGAMIAQMKENLKLDEIMAGLTGTDIRDRIKARNEFRKDAVVASVLRGKTEEQIAAYDMVAKGIGNAGTTVGPLMQKAFNNIMLGLTPDSDNTAFSQLAQAANEVGVDLRSQLRNSQTSAELGMDPGQIGVGIQTMLDALKNADVERNMQRRAQLGQEGASLLVSAQMDIMASAADGVKTTGDLFEAELTRFTALLATANAGGDDAFGPSRLANQMQVTGAEMRVRLLEEIMDTLNINPTGAGGLGDFADSMEKLADPSNTTFTAILKAMVGSQMFSTGTEGLVDILGISNKPDAEPGSAADLKRISAQGAFFLNIAAAAGVKGAATALGIASTANTAIELAQATATIAKDNETTAGILTGVMEKVGLIAAAYDKVAEILGPTTPPVVVTVDNNNPHTQ